MDFVIEDRTGERRQSSAAASVGERPGIDPRLIERRGEAMRRLFPKSLLRSGRPEGGVALRIHAHLEAAGTPQDLQRRLRSVSRYPVELVEEVRLRDGRRVLVRPVLPADAEMQRAFVRSMTAATRRNRFHGAVADLPVDVLRYMTEIDYVDHLALIGELADGSGQRQVAEARWVRRRDEPQSADFAIAIADDCQNRGLGNALLDRLERGAAARGVERLHAHVLHTNRRMIGWLEARAWSLCRDADDPGVWCAQRLLRRSPMRAWREAA